jgi:chromosomal replication initiator protein
MHGSPGTGKTHLISTLLKELTHEGAVVTARCVPAGELARPDNPNENEGFADRGLLSCDLLVVEDIQHLSSRFADAACRLIDHRVARRKPLVITASVGPAGLKDLPRRLTSRMAAGLVVQLEPPGMSSRSRILEREIAARGIRLTGDAVDWLAAHGSGVRSALGLLQSLSHAATRLPGPLDRTTAERILAGNGQPTSSRCDPRAILERVAAVFGISEDELLGTSRLPRTLVPRQVAMYLTRELTGLSLPQIGAFFGGRDHTTVLHACRKIQAELAENELLVATVRQVRAELE